MGLWKLIGKIWSNRKAKSDNQTSPLIFNTLVSLLLLILGWFWCPTLISSQCKTGTGDCNIHSWRRWDCERCAVQDQEWPRVDSLCSPHHCLRWRIFEFAPQPLQTSGIDLGCTENSLSFQFLIKIYIYQHICLRLVQDTVENHAPVCRLIFPPALLDWSWRTASCPLKIMDMSC